jgi:RNA recognition motif-containing protein
LFVGNLSYDVTESDLREFFSPVGPLTTVIIPMDRDTGKPRGFAFVEFSDQEQANEASSRLNDQPLKGRNVSINEARARESRPGGGPGTRPAGGSFRPGSTPRPSPGVSKLGSDQMEPERSGRAERRNRNFKVDAKPGRKKRQNYGSRGDFGGRKGPIREKGGGQFFGNIEDDDYEDELDFKYRP